MNLVAVYGKVRVDNHGPGIEHLSLGPWATHTEESQRDAQDEEYYSGARPEALAGHGAALQEINSLKNPYQTHQAQHHSGYTEHPAHFRPLCV